MASGWCLTPAGVGRRGGTRHEVTFTEREVITVVTVDSVGRFGPGSGNPTVSIVVDAAPTLQPVRRSSAQSDFRRGWCRILPAAPDRDDYAP
ncbi:hypothetical protein GCM10009760_02950 [Kitasatospora kazusensis]|uniref:Uncharacterized protein n=1 Tax=Kitasatospora kazusensis TaxID=407974 RepID=A0ABN2YRB0_9ACTN